MKQNFRPNLISVIIPVYNAGKFLGECIESVLAQTYDNFEIIIINDGSTDSSVEIVKEYITKDSRIKLFHQENAGPSAARNHALKEASGEYVMKLDADDFVSSDYMSEAIRRMLETEADAAISDMYLYVSDKELYRHTNTFTKTYIDYNSDIISGIEGLLRSITWDAIHSSLIIRRSIYKKIYYDTSGTFGDEVTERRLISKCCKLAYSPGKYYYRFNQDSVTKKVSAKLFDLCKSLVQTKDLLFEYNVYDDAVKQIECKMLNTLTYMQYYYFAHKHQLSNIERLKAKCELALLFKNINKNWLEGVYRQKGFFNFIFFRIKMFNMTSFIILSRILYIKMRGKYGI